MSRGLPPVSWKKDDPVELQKMRRMAEEPIRDIRVQAPLTILLREGRATIGLRPDATPRFPVVRVQVTTVPDQDAYPRIMLVKTWNGTSLGEREFPVRADAASAAVMEEEDEFYAFQPLGGLTDGPVSYSGESVTWEGLPVPCDGSGATKALGGTGATADTESWDAETDGPNVNYTVLHRVYDDTANDELLGFYRVHQEVCGRKTSIGPELKVVIVTMDPECPE